jgi:hypothetical protein
MLLMESQPVFRQKYMFSRQRVVVISAAQHGSGEVRLDAYANSGMVTAYTGNSERLRIDRLGNVGIGT